MAVDLHSAIDNNIKNTSDHIWSKILSNVTSSGSTKLPSGKQLLLLGDNNTGKTTLVAKLQDNENSKNGYGLEYSHILVRDEYRDATTQLGVWTLDGDVKHSHLLKFALGPEDIDNTIVIVTVSMTTPWDIMSQLHSWLTLLQDFLDNLNVPTDLVRQRQATICRLWREYVEPGDEIDSLPSTVLSSHTDLISSGEESAQRQTEEVETSLSEGVLTRNLGMQLIVVVTKTDYMSMLEKDYDFKEEHFDFIQQYVRRFCLQHGAALFYTSVKEDKNCDILYKYVVHKLYGFMFQTPALCVEKDAVFIPSGWDSMSKISILYEGLNRLKHDAYYADVIMRPLLKKPLSKDAEVQAEDEQLFLSKIQQKLSSDVIASTNRTPNAAKSSDLRHINSPLSSSFYYSSGKKADVSKSTSESVVANFFNSLLNKKPANQVRSNISTDNNIDMSIVRSDAATELERLTRSPMTSTPFKLDSDPSDLLSDSESATSALNQARIEMSSLAKQSPS